MGEIKKFPHKLPPPEPWCPPMVQSELDRIHRWLEQAQSSLARLPGADPEDHRALRRIADRLRGRVLEGAGLTSAE